MDICRPNLRWSISLWASLFLLGATSGAWGYVYTVADLRPLDIHDITSPDMDPGGQTLRWADAATEVCRPSLFYRGGWPAGLDAFKSIDVREPPPSLVNATPKVYPLALAYGAEKKFDLVALVQAGPSLQDAWRDAGAHTSAHGGVNDSALIVDWVRDPNDPGFRPHRPRARARSDIASPSKTGGEDVSDQVTRLVRAFDSTAKIGLAFEIYSGYIVPDRFGPGVTKSFAVITDEKQLGKFLGVAALADAKSLLDAQSQRIPQDVFKSRILLVVVNDPNRVWRYSVRKVSIDEGVVQVEYTSKAKKNVASTFAFARPLIISIPKGNYKAVEFVEDQRLATMVELRQTGGK